MKETGLEMEDELRPEYDLAELLKGGVQGKYAERYREGANLVLLTPDVAAAFCEQEMAEARWKEHAFSPTQK